MTNRCMKTTSLVGCNAASNVPKSSLLLTFDPCWAIMAPSTDERQQMKPRATNLNKLLGTKRHAVHKTAKRPSRQQQNAQTKKLVD